LTKPRTTSPVDKQVQRSKSPSPFKPVQKPKSPSPFKPVQKPKSPSPFVQKPKSPSPFVQKPKSPSPFVQKPKSPSPFVQKPKSPSPFVQKQKSPSPFVQKQKSQSPFKHIERPKSPGLFARKFSHIPTPLRSLSDAERAAVYGRRSPQDQVIANIQKRKIECQRHGMMYNPITKQCTQQSRPTFGGCREDCARLGKRCGPRGRCIKL
jgi:hypothetical protein